jgi:hypothetical protein
MNLYEQWMEAKAAETEMTARRRALEDEMTKSLQITEDWEGSYTMKDGGFKINIKRAFTRKVDGKKLSAIAGEFGLQDYLPTLFRWKPEIDMKAWKDAEPSITDKLAQAVTTTPGRVSFKIEEEEI